MNFYHQNSSKEMDFCCFFFGISVRITGYQLNIYISMQSVNISSTNGPSFLKASFRNPSTVLTSASRSCHDQRLKQPSSKHFQRSAVPLSSWSGDSTSGPPPKAAPSDAVLHQVKGFQVLRQKNSAVMCYSSDIYDICDICLCA